MVKQFKIYKNFQIQKYHHNSILLIGNFDGLHIGHQKLFKNAKKMQSKKKHKIGVLTFDPMPKMFFNKKIENHRICNLDQKIKLFKKFGVNFVINKKIR